MDRTLAKRTYSFASIADVNVVDGILTAQSTVTTTSSFTSGDMNGSVISSGFLVPPRMPTITRSLATGSYTTDPIVFTGKRGGSLVTTSVVQPNADGGDTLTAGVLYDSLESVAVPAMGNTTGSYSLGVQDIGANVGDVVSVKMNVAGPSVLTLAYADDGTHTDTIEATNTIEPVGAKRIATANMTQGFTAYFF